MSLTCSTRKKRMNMPTLLELKNEHRRCQALVRQRSKLTTEEQGYLNTHLPAVEAAVEEAFAELTKVGRTTIMGAWKNMPKAQAVQELADVHPTLEGIGDPTATINSIIELDGMDATAFETARDAMTLRTMIDSQMSLWDAWWGVYGIASSIDALDSSFKAQVLDILAIKAELAAFLTFYEVTMKRVDKVYEKTSRIITVLSEPAWTAPSIPQRSSKAVGNPNALAGAQVEDDFS